jgi:hypothetical protein
MPSLRLADYPASALPRCTSVAFGTSARFIQEVVGARNAAFLRNTYRPTIHEQFYVLRFGDSTYYEITMPDRTVIKTMSRLVAGDTHLYRVAAIIFTGGAAAPGVAAVLAI